jgi:hypothetical protein
MFDSQRSVGWVAVIVLTITAVSTTEAQEDVGSFQDLGSLISVGDRVAITDLTGRATEGSLIALSASGLALMVDGTRVEFAGTDVETVSRRDSRWSGTLWGLGIGGALGASFERALAGEYGRDDIGYGSALVPFAAIGAGIGFGVDALIKGERIIYSRSHTSPTSVSVSPMWNPSRKGIRVSVRF